MEGAFIQPLSCTEPTWPKTQGLLCLDFILFLGKKFKAKERSLNGEILSFLQTEEGN
jgi:hypothetical protein